MVGPPSDFCDQVAVFYSLEEKTGLRGGRHDSRRDDDLYLGDILFPKKIRNKTQIISALLKRWQNDGSP